jgi:hypothetical protein
MVCRCIGGLDVSFSKSLSEIKPRKAGLPCGIQRALESMTDEDRELLNNILFDETRAISNPDLQQVLIQEGYPVSYSSVSQHRRKQCRCFVGQVGQGAVTNANLYV